MVIGIKIEIDGKSTKGLGVSIKRKNYDPETASGRLRLLISTLYEELERRGIKLEK